MKLRIIVTTVLELDDPTKDRTLQEYLNLISDVGMSAPEDIDILLSEEPKWKSPRIINQ